MSGKHAAHIKVSFVCQLHCHKMFLFSSSVVFRISIHNKHGSLGERYFNKKQSELSSNLERHFIFRQNLYHTSPCMLFMQLLLSTQCWGGSQWIALLTVGMSCVPISCLPISVQAEAAEDAQLCWQSWTTSSWAEKVPLLYVLLESSCWRLPLQHGTGLQTPATVLSLPREDFILCCLKGRHSSNS